MAKEYAKKHITPTRRGGSSEWRRRDWYGLFQREAGDGTAGDVFVRVGRHVGVGDVLEAADAGGQDEPFG